MRHNNRKTKTTKPAILIAESTLKDLEKIAKTGNTKLIKDRIYKGKRTEAKKDIFDVRIALAEVFHNKCAYFESIEHKPEVEHFPQKAVFMEKIILVIFGYATNGLTFCLLVTFAIPKMGNEINFLFKELGFQHRDF